MPLEKVSNSILLYNRQTWTWSHGYHLRLVSLWYVFRWFKKM